MIRPWLASLVLAAAASAAYGADEFYAQRLEEGRRSFQAKQYDQAVISLRIASFGLIKDPPRYQESLVWLALSYKHAGRETESRDTLRRIASVEARFPGSYDTAPLAPETRQAFEKVFVAEVPPEVLRESGRFARFVKSEEEKLAQLPAGERHRALEKKAGEDPASGAWDLLNARLYLEEGNARLAEKFSSRALAASSGKDEQARLVHAVALARLSRCKAAVPEFEALSEERRSGDAGALAEYGICLIRDRRSEDAMRVLSMLPPEVASRPEVARELEGLKAERARAETARAEAARTEAAKAEAARAEAARAAAARAEAEKANAAKTEKAGTGPPVRDASRARAVVAESARLEPTPAPTPRAPAAAAKTTRDLTRRAQESLGARDFAQAESLLKDALRASPEDRNARLLLGQVHYMKGDWQAGVAVFRGVAPLARDEAVFDFFYTVCLFNSGRRVEAKALLLNVLPLLPPNSPVVETYKKLILGTSP